MGQRHQIFLKIVNPVEHMTKYARISPSEKAELIKEFGTGKYSILAYHDQWLYGRSALQTAMNLLKFAKQFTVEEKTKDSRANTSPICPYGIESKYKTSEKLSSAIGFIMNYRPIKTDYSSAGIGESFYIGKTDEGINFDFTLGDNNDGITIIDMVENKYCFMNINTQRRNAHSASQLPQYKPSTAKQYVKAYYGETEGTINDYYIKDKTPKEIEKVLAYNKRMNAKCYKPFEKFELLTIDEIKEMFSTMEMFKPKPKGTKITLFEKK